MTFNPHCLTYLAILILGDALQDCYSPLLTPLGSHVAIFIAMFPFSLDGNLCHYS